MTSTLESFNQPEAIVDEYVKQGFDSIFLRYLSPYGFAAKAAANTRYETDRFVDFFNRALSYILRLNREGILIREVYTSLLLRRMLTPFSTGYVDLQSPSGIGISVLAYNYDGDVYASDEGRMLAEMGDRTFRLGTVHDPYEQLFLDSSLLPTIFDTILEGVPECSECALLPYCGSDPVYHHRTQGDSIGHRPTSGFCSRNMEIMRHLLRLLEDDPGSAAILRSWV
jgi:sulfatase maturation enzyme AslB (radical SAM superfamily)